jgi:hypothetical protein
VATWRDGVSLKVNTFSSSRHSVMRPARSASFAADASTSAAASRPTRATPRASRRRVVVVVGK